MLKDNFDKVNANIQVACDAFLARIRFRRL